MIQKLASTSLAIISIWFKLQWNYKGSYNGNCTLRYNGASDFLFEFYCFLARFNEEGVWSTFDYCRSVKPMGT